MLNFWPGIPAGIIFYWRYPRWVYFSPRWKPSGHWSGMFLWMPPFIHIPHFHKVLTKISLIRLVHFSLNHCGTWFHVIAKQPASSIWNEALNERRDFWDRPRASPEAPRFGSGWPGLLKILAGIHYYGVPFIFLARPKYLILGPGLTLSENVKQASAGCIEVMTIHENDLYFLNFPEKTTLQIRKKSHV